MCLPSFFVYHQRPTSRVFVFVRGRIKVMCVLWSMIIVVDYDLVRIFGHLRLVTVFIGFLSHFIYFVVTSLHQLEMKHFLEGTHISTLADTFDAIEIDEENSGTTRTKTFLERDSLYVHIVSSSLSFSLFLVTPKLS